MELLLMKASLSQWRSLLAHCEREAFIGAPGKNISPRMLNFSEIHHQTHS
jgi:hypothetical protein